MLTDAGDEGVCTWDTDPVLFACMDGDLKALRALLAGNPLRQHMCPYNATTTRYYICALITLLQTLLLITQLQMCRVERSPPGNPLLHMCPHNLNRYEICVVIRVLSICVVIRVRSRRWKPRPRSKREASDAPPPSSPQTESILWREHTSIL
jgi:hypothetical protein